jgi:hypothetical protein
MKTASSHRPKLNINVAEGGIDVEHEPDKIEILNSQKAGIL